MAISSYKVFLMKGSGTGSTPTYSKLVDIKTHPDMGSAPDMLETTTLSDPMRTYIPGIQGVEGGLEFTANYTKSDYQTLEALKDTETQFALWIGGTESAGVATPTGSDGKFSFKGYLSVWLAGAGVNEVETMNISIAQTTALTYSAGT